MIHFHHWLTSLNSPEKWTQRLDHFSDVSISVIGVVVVYLIVRFAIAVIAERIAKPFLKGQSHIVPDDRGRLRTLSGLIRSVSTYMLNFVFAVALLRALNFDAISVVSTASFAGLAFGFGAQKLVKDVINGFFLIMENQYDVGDYVTINTITGTVEEIGMRIMKIRDDSGKLYILSNGDITQVCNMSRGALVGTIEIGIASGEDPAEAAKHINAVGQDLLAARPDLGLVDAPKSVGIGSVDATHVVIKVAVKVALAPQLAVAQTALRGLIRDRLHENGIYIG
ncbi:MAG: mechanosensitive ion channel family protein [Capsulimonadaceae bacterium]|nr:mechanosensitive ion channel family protein [Capsulimonadaceae bacterium]